MMVANLQNYKIIRVGRRCTGRVVALSSGRKLRLRATGHHVAALAPSDVSALLRIPGVRLIKIPAAAPAPPVTAPAPKTKTKAKKAAKGAKKGA